MPTLREQHPPGRIQDAGKNEKICTPLSEMNTIPLDWKNLDNATWIAGARNGEKSPGADH